MAGITKFGFERKRYADIEKEMFLSAKEKWGEEINLSEKSALGILLRIFAWSIAKIWQLGESIYFQSFLRYAEGIQLDYIAERGGIKRFPKAKSKGKLIIRGNTGKEVYRGFQVRTESGKEYQVTRPGVISENGTVVLPAESLLCGSEQNAEVGEITIVSYPETGITSVTNEEAFVGAREEETDEELRRRYKAGLKNKGKSTIAGIEKRILENPSVKSVIIEENDTETANYGIPAHGIRVIVQGGSDEEIARAILESKAAGISTAGAVAVTIQDNKGKSRVVRFQRTTAIMVYAVIRLSFYLGIENKEQLKEKVQTDVLNYLLGLYAGEDIVVSRLVSLVMGNKEIKDAAVKIGKTEQSLEAKNIVLAEGETVITDKGKVKVSDDL